MPSSLLHSQLAQSISKEWAGPWLCTSHYTSQALQRSESECGLCACGKCRLYEEGGEVHGQQKHVHRTPIIFVLTYLGHPSLAAQICCLCSRLPPYLARPSLAVRICCLCARPDLGWAPGTLTWAAALGWRTESASSGGGKK